MSHNQPHTLEAPKRRIPKQLGLKTGALLLTAGVGVASHLAAPSDNESGRAHSQPVVASEASGPKKLIDGVPKHIFIERPAPTATTVPVETVQAPATPEVQAPVPNTAPVSEAAPAAPAPTQTTVPREVVQPEPGIDIREPLPANAQEAMQDLHERIMQGREIDCVVGKVYWNNTSDSHENDGAYDNVTNLALAARYGNGEKVHLFKAVATQDGKDLVISELPDPANTNTVVVPDSKWNPDPQKPSSCLLSINGQDLLAQVNGGALGDRHYTEAWGQAPDISGTGVSIEP